MGTRELHPNSTMILLENKKDYLLQIVPLSVYEGQLLGYVAPGNPIVAEKDKVGSPFWGG